MTPTRAVVAGGLVALAATLVVLLAQSRPQLASTDRVSNDTFVTGLGHGQRLCQRNEIVPADTAALRMTIGTYGKPGPPLEIVISAPADASPHSRQVPISSTKVAPGWRQGLVTLGVQRVRGTHADATVCITDHGSPLAIAGVNPPGDYGLQDVLDGKKIASEVRIDYMLPGSPTWFAMLTTIAYRMTLGKGTYIGPLGWIAPLLLMLALVGVVVRVLLSDEPRRRRRWNVATHAKRSLSRGTASLRRLRLPSRRLAGCWAFIRRALARPPRLAYWCAFIATLNALAWSVITPPFEVPDENAHYAYVQQLVEARALPHQQAVYTGLSPREDATIVAVHGFELPGASDNPAPLTGVEQQQLDAVQHEQLSALGSGDALSAAPNPPLYYALEAIPYAISPSHSVLNRLALMRVLSAIFAGFTVFFVFMFLRELLPGTRWVWPVGAIAVALQPLFAFISGGLNNDVLLYTFAAALFFAIARMFRRGLNERTGLAIGVAFGLGVLVKFTLFGFAPAAALAVLYGAWRARHSARRASLRGAGIAAAVGVVPALAYLGLAHRVLTSGGVGPGSAIAVVGVPSGLRGELDHIWQLFLPTLPGLGPNQFPVVELWHEWFLGLVGRFGWLDTRFAYWVYLVAAPIAIALVVGALADLVREHARVRRHAVELAIYIAMVGGLCIEIGVESYRTLVTGGGIFEQPRYLLSCLCIYAVVVALVARLPGRRWGPAIGALIVILALSHDLFSQMQAISRYYA